MTTFYLVRHAEKDSASDFVPGRSAGIHLSAAGRRQSAALARRLAGLPLERVISGPLERAQETAQAIAEPHGLPVEIAPALHEFDFGEWTNLTFAQLERLPLWQPFNTFRSGTPIPGGESMLQLQARFVGAMLEWREHWPEAHVVLVSHGDPIRSALCHFAGAPLDFFHRFEIAPASISIVVLDRAGPRILRLNELVPVVEMDDG